MKRPPQPKARPTGFSWPAPGSPIVAVAFFVLFFFYIGLRVEPSLEYPRSAAGFFLGGSFLRPFLSHPGGLVEYAAAFLALLSYHNWQGALIFTLAGCLAFLATQQTLSQLSPTGRGGAWARGDARPPGGLESPLNRQAGKPALRPNSVVALVPPLLLLVMRDHYEWPSLAIGLGWLLAMGLALGYMVLRLTGRWLRLLAGWAVSVGLFYVAGFWPCLLFALLVGCFEIVTHRNWATGIGCALSILVAPVWLLGLPDTDAAKTLNPWGEGQPLVLAAAFHLFVPLAAGMLAWVRPSPAETRTGPRDRRRASGAGPTPRWFERTGVTRFLAAGLFCAGWLWVWLAFDALRAAELKIDHYSSRGDYEKVLAIARDLKATSSSADVRLHLALYHTGRLGQDLFSFGRQSAWTLLPALQHGLESCRAQSETLLELGQVHLAEHFAHEALEHEGDRPDLLWLLARINVLRERPKAARVFLSVLRQAPFQRKRAGAWLRNLEANPHLPDDPELARIRSLMVSTDLPHTATPTESILLQLLQANRRNQMAFEYLMAHLLLTRQTQRIVAEIGRLDDFGYPGIPRHYEEAILLHQRSKSGGEIDLHGRQIRPATIQRFQQFCAAASRLASAGAEGRQALARDFGDTYWYYDLSRPAAPAAPPGKSATP